MFIVHLVRRKGSKGKGRLKNCWGVLKQDMRYLIHFGSVQGMLPGRCGAEWRLES